MNKTMYEINWHSVDNVFSHCSVTPITVIREGIFPGCSSVSITAIDSEGNKFQGSPEYYYLTEEEAWEAIKIELESNIKTLTREIETLHECYISQVDFLEKINNK